MYGPLAEFPIEPRVVLIFADALQGLVLSEAVARVDKSLPPQWGGLPAQRSLRPLTPAMPC